MKILFLDDMPSRVPMLRRGEDVEYVRTSREFVEWLIRYGTPDCISFDHDLSEEHYGSDGGYMNPDRPPTGTDCARWAIEKSFIPRVVIVHSWNTDGSRRIANCFKGTTVEKIIVRPFNPNHPHMWEEL